jgi:hypothetical protein
MDARRWCCRDVGTIAHRELTTNSSCDTESLDPHKRESSREWQSAWRITRRTDHCPVRA